MSGDYVECSRAEWTFTSRDFATRRDAHDFLAMPRSTRAREARAISPLAGRCCKMRWRCRCAISRYNMSRISRRYAAMMAIAQLTFYALVDAYVIPTPSRRATAVCATLHAYVGDECHYFIDGGSDTR